MRRAAVFFATLALVALCAEGALSLLGGHSLRELDPDWRAASAPGPVTPPAAAPAASPGAPPADGPAADEPSAAGPKPQLYAAHDDPLVGYVLKPDTEQWIFDGRIQSDHLGLRRRPGPPPLPEATRLVVLGDSIAFGLGVSDDRVLAARLEARLAEARGDGLPPVVCRTVATPSWNWRAAGAFLLDHWDELRPEIVLYLPCFNDVWDLDGTTLDGGRRPCPDPSSADPWLTVSVRVMQMIETRPLLAAQGGTLSEEDLGADAVRSDLCAESRRRHDENAAGIAELGRRLAARGCRLAIVWHSLDDYTRFLGERLARLAPELPQITLLQWTRAEFTLGVDPHPNAEAHDVFATWLAEDLLARGWVSAGAGRALPAVPRAYTELRGATPTPDECRAWSEQARERWRSRLRPEIDFVGGSGLLQVFGGVNSDRSARSRLLAILAPEGRRLELDLAPLARRPDLFPLDVAVEAGGARLGTVTIPPDATVHARFDLPADVDRGQPLEVRLSPADWVVLGTQLASFRPLRLACPADR